MNLRILKKLSKRAAPYLAKLGDGREQFPAEKGENYHGLLIRARKHFDRSRCHPSYQPSGQLESVYVTRAGHAIVMRPPSVPLKGTMMVGGMSGYYEPEWGEESCWEALASLIFSRFTDWGALAAEEFDGIAPTGPIMLRELSTPSMIFKAADEMVAELACEAAR